MKDYSGMTIEELEEAKRNIGNKLRILRKELHRIQLVYNSRQSEIKAKKIAEGLSDKERASLAQVLSPKGVATKEAVGKPGV